MRPERLRLARPYLDAGGRGRGGRHARLSPMDVPLPRCAGAATRRAPAAAAWPCLPRVAEAPCAVVCCRLYGRESRIATAVALQAAGWPQKETS